MSPLDGWTAVARAGEVVLVPARDPRGAEIRVRERQRPLRGVGDLGAGTVERLTTLEGEHAALVALDGGGLLGVVFGDDDYARFDARVGDPALAAETREALRALVVGHVLGLGALRCRRFEYEPPAGWLGLPLGLATRWVPPGFPADDAMLTVFPARPAGRPLALIETLRRGTRAAERTPLLVGSAAGTGEAWRSRVAGDDGRVREVVEAVFSDGHFDYAVRFEASPQAARAHAEIAARLLRSLQPVPRAGVASGADACAHWVG